MRKKSQLIKYMTNFEYLHLFQRYSPPNFEVVQNWAKFCMFLAPKFFSGEGPPKFWTSIIKFRLVLITMQNFAPIGRRIAISRCNKKTRNFGARPNVSLPGAVSPIGRKNLIWYPDKVDLGGYDATSRSP